MRYSLQPNRIYERDVGDGPIHACYRAIDRITGLPGRLLDYSVNAVTRGKDALGEVFVHVEFEGKNYIGKAASLDIIDASARAYLNAVNKVIHEKQRQAKNPDVSAEKAGTN